MKRKFTLYSPAESFVHVDEMDQILVGRSHNCNFVIPHESVSREHCLIEVIDDKMFVTDLGSKNGITKFGIKIIAHERTEFDQKSEIKIAGKFLLRVENNNSDNTATRSSNVITEHQTNTKTIQFELSEQEKKKKRKPPVKEASLAQKYNWVKMATGFIVVLGFLAYKLLTRP